MSLPIRFLRDWLLRRHNQSLRNSVSYSALLRYRQHL